MQKNKPKQKNYTVCFRWSPSGKLMVFTISEKIKFFGYLDVVENNNCDEITFREKLVCAVPLNSSFRVFVQLAEKDFLKFRAKNFRNGLRGILESELVARENLL